MTCAGPYCVAIYPLGLDPPTTSPLQSLVDPKHQRAIAVIEVLDQEQQQAVSQPEGQPPGTVENVVVTGKARVVAESHDNEVYDPDSIETQ